MLQLGKYYYSYCRPERDRRKSVTLWERAANLNNTVAMTLLGCCYMNGKGVEKDEGQAVSLWQKATDMNDIRAMVRLGACYIHGVHVQFKPSKGLHLWEKAAFLQSKEAMNLLGECFHENRFTVNKTQSRHLNTSLETEEWRTQWKSSKIKHSDFIVEMTTFDSIDLKGLRTHPQDLHIPLWYIYDWNSPTRYEWI